MPLGNNPVTNFSLKEWIRHPTTILLIVVSLVAWTVTGLFINSKTNETKEHKARADKYESRFFEYTNTIMFKEATEKELKEQIRVKQSKIDSLTGGN